MIEPDAERRGRLRDRVVVEELDEVRLARIERRLLSASAGLRDRAAAEPSSRAWGRFLWPACAMVATVAAMWSWWRAEPRSAVHDRQVVAVQRIAGGTQVELGGATVIPGPRGDFLLRTGNDGATEVVLHGGRIDCEVEPRDGRPPFLVYAGATTVTVIGTKFSVTREGDGAVVEVERGTVAVDHGDTHVRISARQRWSVGEGVNAVSQLVARADDRADADEPTAQPVSEASTIDDLVEGPSSSVEEPARRRSRGRPADRKRSADRVPAQQRSRSTAVDSSAELRAFAPYRRPPGLDPIWATGSGSLREIEARYLERSITPGDSDAAAYALYSLAYWQLYRMRRPGAAIKTAKRYEDRFRRGAHAESVLWVRLAALCAAGEHSQCRAAAHSYLRRFPGGRFSGHAKQVIDANR